MVLAGVDGCKAGWAVVLYDGNRFDFHVYSTIRDLVKEYSNITRILIDIPIGLGSQKSGFRDIEQLLRKELPGRSSTIFNPPCREVLTITDYHKANRVNRMICDKGLSIQAFNITPKIRQIDSYLHSRGSGPELVESHPEICFRYLNSSKSVLLTKKSTNEGYLERLEIMEDYVKGSSALLEKWSRATKKSRVKKDDIVDAFCLCVANLQGANNLKYLVGNLKRDDLGIEIKVGYADPG